jgi:hypothetical protein
MKLIDLTGEFAGLVKASRSTIEFKARFWSWLDEQRRGGPLAALLEDMERHWSTVGEAPSLSEARDVLRHLSPSDHRARVPRIGERFRAVAGELPTVDVILLAGLERPEGYSRFDGGSNTIFVGLDHPTALAYSDHLELILAHEMCHAVRDPDHAVLGDYGGTPSMSHDEFVALHPFREHLVSEALATSISEAAYPGRPDRRYIYFEEEAIGWCEEHRREVTDRMLLALEREEPYQTFYSPGSVTPDSPDCCDYWFGLHLGRHALGQASAHELLRLPSSEFLRRYLGRFVDSFVAGRRGVLAPSLAREQSHPVVAAGEEPLAEASLPESVRRVYDEYRELLDGRPGLARELEQRLDAAIAQTGLRHGHEPWLLHAFPLLLSSDEERHLRWATDGLMRLVEQVVDLYREDPEVRAFFAFPEHVEELCLLEPGFRPHATLGRFDSYWSGRRLRFLELNANGAAMWTVAEALGEAVFDLPGLSDLLERYRAQSWPLTSRMLDGLLAAWHQARGVEASPRRMAIVDWKGIATESEQRRLAERFTRMGVPTDVLSPEQLGFEQGELCGPAGPIDLVYRRLTTIDLVERPGELEALIEAARCGAVVTVGSYASDVAHSKRLFAFLTHERWQRMLSPAERALVDAHVPWTRMFVPGRTQFEGRRSDLRELALAHRERFVLKPAEGYEGRGVLLGVETPSDQWHSEVERRYGGPHVIQEVVHAPLRELLLPRGDGVEQVSRWLHLGHFVISGQLAGFLARTTEELVLGISSEERILPCLVLADEPGVGADRDLGPATP